MGIRGHFELARIITAFCRGESVEKWRAARVRRDVYIAQLAWCSALSPREDWLAVGGAHAMLILFSLAAPPSEPCVLNGHLGEVWSVAFAPDSSICASGSTDNTVKLWRVHGAKSFLGSMTAHTEAVTCVGFTMDSRQVLSCSYDRTIVLSSATTLAALKVFAGHSNRVLALAVAKNGIHLCSASFDQTLCVWSLQQRPVPLLQCEHTAPVTSVCYSPNSRTIVSGCRCNVYIWCASSGALLQTLTGHLDTVRSVCFLNSSFILASGSADGLIRVCNLKGDYCTLTHSGTLACLGFAARTSRLISCGGRGSVLMWG